MFHVLYRPPGARPHLISLVFIGATPILIRFSILQLLKLYDGDSLRVVHPGGWGVECFLRFFSQNTCCVYNGQLRIADRYMRFYGPLCFPTFSGAHICYICTTTLDRTSRFEYRPLVEEHRIQMLRRPARSPTLNQIKHVCWGVDELRRHVWPSLPLPCHDLLTLCLVM